MTTEALTMSQDDLFHRLRAAYLRGAKWAKQNIPYAPAEVEKAANDYADAVVSPLTPKVEKVETPAQGNPSPEAQKQGDPVAYISHWTLAQLAADHSGDYRLTVPHDLMNDGQVALYTTPPENREVGP